VLTRLSSRSGVTAGDDFGGILSLHLSLGPPKFLGTAARLLIASAPLPRRNNDNIRHAGGQICRPVPPQALAILNLFENKTLNTMNARLQYELRGWAYWAKCLNPLRNTVTINDLPLGLQMRAYKRDAVGRGLYRRKIHEPFLTKLLLERFAGSAPRNFIDVGANIGYFTCLMSKFAGPAGKVLAVEPEPNNLELLRQNIAANELRNVEIFPCAVGATEGSAMLGLYKPSNRGRHSILDTTAKSQVKVPVKTLDKIASSVGAGVHSWSLLKIDVEGYEAFVIDGAKETLPHVEALVMEFSPALWKRSGSDPAAILRALRQNFTRIYRLGSTELMRVSIDDCLQSDQQTELWFER
jgi:FkbM family methyltransferase